jgi:hypothetical protein
MDIIAIFYVQNKNSVIKQINSIIQQKIKIDLLFILDNNDYIQFFSNYGIVVVTGTDSEEFLSRKYQMGYDQIKLHNYDYIIEINSDFYINENYIKICKEQLIKNDIVGSNSYITYNLLNKSVHLNKIKNTGQLNNIIFCRCINKSFLDKINWKIFNFNKNIDVFSYSQIYCNLQSANIHYLISCNIYKIIKLVYNF